MKVDLLQIMALDIVLCVRYQVSPRHAQYISVFYGAFFSCFVLLYKICTGTLFDIFVLGSASAILCWFGKFVHQLFLSFPAPRMSSICSSPVFSTFLQRIPQLCQLLSILYEDRGHEISAWMRVLPT